MKQESILEKHRRIWNNKKILKIVYSEWYNKIISDLNNSDKITLELGAGTGNFKEFKPDVVTADIEPHSWLDMSFDAHYMPFQNNEIGNIVLVDVLHHLSNPILFLEEAHRVLEKSGRIILLEPFPTPFSLFIYRKFHPEPFIMDVNYFSKSEINLKDPWDANQAIPYLLFYKNLDKFSDKFSHKFRFIKKEKLSFILYPLSGGFENKAMIKDWMIPFFQIIEKSLSIFKNFISFRCYIVIEKI